MAAEAKVQEALRLLQEAGRLDLVRAEVVGALWPARRAANGVVAAVLACSPPRRVSPKKKPVSVRQKGRARALSRQSRGKGWGRGMPARPSYVQHAMPKRAELEVTGDRSCQRWLKREQSRLQGARRAPRKGRAGQGECRVRAQGIQGPEEWHLFKADSPAEDVRGWDEEGVAALDLVSDWQEGASWSSSEARCIICFERFASLVTRDKGYSRNVPGKACSLKFGTSTEVYKYSFDFRSGVGKLRDCHNHWDCRKASLESLERSF
ncbi:hypothetical protein NDU88_004424 [Pleurodeles waltl]|uniref:Uncharacterized protein n=1 Tax=Pleurodeles waltl TaxID=8319 RepID=A0AAV7LJU0_PLEWA|nr:hypothetical protein NDU88_004424 [Pleurodeles waltl]